jgi:DtxR family Mn-dependent transcriptional regulator
MEISAREATYIKVIGKLTNCGEKPTSSIEIAKELGVKAPSAVDMIKKLESMGIVEHTPWRGVKLTDKGIMEYKMLIRKYKIIETYLHRICNMNLDEACECASKFDVYVPKKVIDTMCACMGHPKRCPHGDEIPSDKECCGVS